MAVRGCLRVLQVLTDPANRHGMQSELALFRQALRDYPSSRPPHRGRRYDYPPEWLGTDVNHFAEDTRSRPPVCPLIAYALHQAVAYDGHRHREEAGLLRCAREKITQKGLPTYANFGDPGWSEQNGHRPYDEFFISESGHGTLSYRREDFTTRVLVDVTDFPAVHYGFQISNENWVPGIELFPNLVNVDQYLMAFPFALKRPCERRAVELLRSMPYLGDTDRLPSALMIEFPFTSIKKPPPSPPAHVGPRSLVEQAFLKMLQGPASCTETADDACSSSSLAQQQVVLADDATTLPRRLQLLLTAQEQVLHRAPHCAALLSHAFRGEKHLAWATFPHLGGEALHDALASFALVHARSLSLCLDTVAATPAQIAAALRASPPGLTQFYFHSAPQFTDTPEDETSAAEEARARAVRASELVAHLTASRELVTRPGVRFLFAEALVAAAIRRPWFVRTPSPAFFEAFPVQNVFVRVVRQPFLSPCNHHGTATWQSTLPVARRNAAVGVAYAPLYVHAAEMMQRPDAFATGFLRILANLQTLGGQSDESLRLLPSVLACAGSYAGPGSPGVGPVLRNPNVADGIDACPLDLLGSHPAADNECLRRWANVPQEKISNFGDCYKSWRRIEKVNQLRHAAWPLVRDLVPGSWTVVVTVEDPWGRWTTEAVPAIRYAFLRVSPQLAQPVPVAAALDRDRNRDLSCFDTVCDLPGFLEKTRHPGQPPPQATAKPAAATLQDLEVTGQRKLAFALRDARASARVPRLVDALNNRTAVRVASEMVRYGADTGRATLQQLADISDLNLYPSQFQRQTAASGAD